MKHIDSFKPSAINQLKNIIQGTPVDKYPFNGGINDVSYLSDFALRQIKDAFIEAYGKNYTITTTNSKWLYKFEQDELDYSHAKKFFESEMPQPIPVGCSSCAKEQWVGRNLDWYYDNKVEFFVKTPARNGYHATMGIAGIVPGADLKAVTSHPLSFDGNLIPFHLQDGINDAGLYCSLNVVPVEDPAEMYKYEEQVLPTKYTIPTVKVADRVCATMLTRYILDHYASINEVKDQLTKYIQIFMPKTFSEGHKYEFHFFFAQYVADQLQTCVLEFNHGKLMFLDDENIMTNFHLFPVAKKYRKDADHNILIPTPAMSEDPKPGTIGVTPHAAGLERYNILLNNFESIVDADTMREAMDKVHYTNCYASFSDGGEYPWYSEVVGDYSKIYPGGSDVTVNTDTNSAQFIQAIDATVAQWESKDRDAETPTVWITTHTSVYDLKDLTLTVETQEGEEGIDLQKFSL